MKICENCGKEIKRKAKTCRHCGAGGQRSPLPLLGLLVILMALLTGHQEVLVALLLVPTGDLTALKIVPVNSPVASMAPGHKCHNCGKTVVFIDGFCPECGAHM